MPCSGTWWGETTDLLPAVKKGWVVTALTVRYLVSTRRGLVALILSWLPLLLTGALAAARVASFDLVLFQEIMVPLFLQIIVIFVTLVSATALIREEIDDGTLPYLLTRPVSKPTLAVSKYVGYMIAGSFLLLPPVFAAWAVTEAYVGASQAVQADVLGGFLAVTILAVLAYGALFYFLSVALRKPLMVGLLIGFIWEAIVGNLPGSVPKLSLIFYLKSVLKGAIPTGTLSADTTLVSASLAAGILVAFSVIMLVLAVWLFQRMEFAQKA